MARKMGNHDTQIEDSHKYLHELMGTIGYMKEDLQKLVNMNQSIYFHDWDCQRLGNGGNLSSQSVKDTKGKQ